MDPKNGQFNVVNLISSILFWAGIVFLIDGSLGLLWLGKWQKRVKGFDIQRIAWIEIGMALGLLVVHYLVV